MKRIDIAEDTLRIIDNGEYRNLHGDSVMLSPHIRTCVAQTQYMEPDQLASLRKALLQQKRPYTQTEYEVFNETTLTGAEITSTQENAGRIGVLNFASARNPGGGFLKGAHAQEESLARSSALYSSLQRVRAFYDYHRTQKTCLYSDRMIYSPGCPVFRKDDGTLLDKPYLVDMLTSPAPNAGVIRRKEPGNAIKIQPVLLERGAKILALFARNECKQLILGAWGCGVFQNDPALVADMFYGYLKPGGEFYGRFQSIRFSVLDTSRDQLIFKAFRDRFEKKIELNNVTFVQRRLCTPALAASSARSANDEQQA